MPCPIKYRDGDNGPEARRVVFALRPIALEQGGLVAGLRELAASYEAPDCKVEFENHGCAPALQLPFDSPPLVKARKALQEEWGHKAVTVGAGGSIPIVGDFKRVLGMDSIMVGFALDDDRVHSPNEKFDLTSFHKGARSWARILAALAG